MYGAGITARRHVAAAGGGRLVSEAGAVQLPAELL
jgi:hypothetical protein